VYACFFHQIIELHPAITTDSTDEPFHIGVGEDLVDGKDFGDFILFFFVTSESAFRDGFVALG
jgi:hypothetical protein